MNHVLVFDSGVGGLSVVSDLRAAMPRLHITYVADDEFRPYGEKTAAQLKARLPGLLKTLCLMTTPDLVVLACNTASTTALSEIRAAVDVPVVGVVPAIKPAAAMSKTKTIAVLGTPGTVARQYVDDLIKQHAQDCRVILHGSTKLVSLAEDKLMGRTVNITAMHAEIAPIFAKSRNIDTIVLACTHFPLIVSDMACVAPTVRWVDSGAAIARRTKSLLEGLDSTPVTYREQIAFLIGGDNDEMRAQMFARYGFEKTVFLPGFS